jgi:hypothetical protein
MSFVVKVTTIVVEVNNILVGKTGIAIVAWKVRTISEVAYKALDLAGKHLTR